eukprot:4801537-Amphidinium_carterae.1
MAWALLWARLSKGVNSALHCLEKPNNNTTKAQRPPENASSPTSSKIHVGDAASSPFTQAEQLESNDVYPKL